MSFLKNTLFVLSVSCSLNIYACEFSDGKAFPSLTVEEGAIVFDLVSIEKEPGDASAGEQLGIDVNFLNCNDGSKKIIGQLPFLADTGKVRAAFFTDAEQDEVNELFVIHSVEIRSDAGVRYSGDYYTVVVYRKNHDGYVQDDRLTKYFGSGGDILDNDYQEFLYVFPYKDQSSISDKLASRSYKEWRSGKPVNLVVNRKSPLYISPVLADITGMYLVAGDKVKQESVEAGWLSVLYRTAKGNVIRGWIQCANADGC